MRWRQSNRAGTASVELAVVVPLTLLLLFGLLVGAMGVFRYQEVAFLAREASRWASVHGAQYATATGKPAATSADVYNNVIVPKAAALNLDSLTYQVTWNTDNGQSHISTVNGQSVQVANTVSVTINYQWVPEVPIFGGATLSATSVCTMSY